LFVTLGVAYFGPSDLLRRSALEQSIVSPSKDQFSRGLQHILEEETISN